MENLNFTFSPDDYYLCKEPLNKCWWPYSLRKKNKQFGKNYEVGMTKIYLNENEAQQAINIGFEMKD